jgi:uncharacterized protein (DUF1330 family)
MAGYVIVDVEVLDPVGYKDYQSRVLATLEAYDGRFLVRGGAAETLEGDWQPHRLVVIEFASTEHARAWYASPEYRAILPIRQRHSRTHHLTIVEGVAP